MGYGLWSGEREGVVVCEGVVGMLRSGTRIYRLLSMRSNSRDRSHIVSVKVRCFKGATIAA
jgi:hypothetical protein